MTITATLPGKFVLDRAEKVTAALRSDINELAKKEKLWSETRRMGDFPDKALLGKLRARHARIDAVIDAAFLAAEANGTVTISDEDCHILYHHDETHQS